MRWRIALRLVAAAAVLALPGCGRREAAQASHAWVRLPAVAGRPGAAYFTLIGGGHATQLVRVESAMAARAEMHESMGGMGDMAGMRPIPRIDLPRAARVAFAPGGRHVMLFGLDPQVKPGTAIPLRFGFADGATAEAEAKTVAAGDDAPY